MAFTLTPRWPVAAVAMWLALVAAPAAARAAANAPDVPELTDTVNDFAQIIDANNRAAIDQLSRSLKAATGDVVVVATVPTIEPYGDIREYANALFANHGKGIGEKGKTTACWWSSRSRSTGSGTRWATASRRGSPTALRERPAARS